MTIPFSHFIIMSQAFAEFLLDNANSGVELLQVLDHIEDCYNEDVATALWYTDEVTRIIT